MNDSLGCFSTKSDLKADTLVASRSYTSISDCIVTTRDPVWTSERGSPYLIPKSKERMLDGSLGQISSVKATSDIMIGLHL